MAGDTQEDLMLEEAVRRHERWISANRSKDTKANIYIAINIFIGLSVLNSDISVIPSAIIISAIGISMICCMFTIVMDSSRQPISTREFLRFREEEYNAEELKEIMTEKYGMFYDTSSLQRKSRLLFVGLVLTSFAFGMIIFWYFSVQT